VAVIIPALNEEKSIGLVLRDIPKKTVDWVILVDNGSTDRTAHVAASLGAIVTYQPERGYGAACLAGIKSLPVETDVIVFLDADYSDHPEEIELLIQSILRNQVDFVVGSRTIQSGSRATLTWQQHWGNRLATKLIEWRFGYRFTDLGPFRAIRRDAFEALAMHDRGYGWTVEMQVKAVCACLKVVEVPVRYRPRIGHSKIGGTFSGALCAGAKILYTIAKHALQHEPCPTRIFPGAQPRAERKCLTAAKVARRLG
jgi:glycosyltransferase involved in cell wall biosynthesis